MKFVSIRGLKEVRPPPTNLLHIHFKNSNLKPVGKQRQNMNDLIKIEKTVLNGIEINSINARDLHTKLEVKKAFTTWIGSALDNAGAIENEDYIKLKSSLEGSGYQIDYILTIDISKHIAMMSKVPKSKEIRDYFIDIEKKYYTQKPLTINEQINLIAQGHQEVNTRLSTVEDEVDYLKNKSPIAYNQLKALEDKRKSKTKQLVGYNPESEQSKKNYSKTISRLTKKFKDRFNISRYADLPKDKFSEALVYLENIELVDLI